MVFIQEVMKIQLQSFLHLQAGVKYLLQCMHLNVGTPRLEGTSVGSLDTRRLSTGAVTA